MNILDYTEFKGQSSKLPSFSSTKRNKQKTKISMFSMFLKILFIMLLKLFFMFPSSFSAVTLRVYVQNFIELLLSFDGWISLETFFSMYLKQVRWSAKIVCNVGTSIRISSVRASNVWTGCVWTGCECIGCVWTGCECIGCEWTGCVSTCCIWTGNIRTSSIRACNVGSCKSWFCQKWCIVGKWGVNQWSTYNRSSNCMIYCAKMKKIKDKL